MSRINTNVASINAQRNMSQTNQAFGRTVGRLSSGFRINRAADDAAGLGIANQLRSDIRALNQASRNASQANSLLQVAEGATNQISNIVDRMKELASQSASDSVNNDDRALIQAEFSQLQEELSRIVDTTKFQGTTLLGGSTGGTPGTTDFVAGSVDAFETAVGDVAGVTSVSVTGTPESAGSFVLSAEVFDDGGTDVFRVTVNGETADFAMTGADVDGGTQTITVDGVSIELTLGNVAAAGLATAINDLDAGDRTFTTETTGGTPGDGELQFLVSVSGNAGTGEDFITLNVQDLRLETLGLDASSLATREGAVDAIGALDAAISTISTALGEIGAAQNRLDFAQANVATTIENFSAAESVIRDADFAAEASEFARLQILQQSQVAMLAQANSAPQGVLQLIG